MTGRLCPRLACRQENAQPLRKPSFLNTIAAGQKPVNEAWIMFTPAKAVNRYQ
jgi:hypothetical protein